MNLHKCAEYSIFRDSAKTQREKDFLFNRELMYLTRMVSLPIPDKQSPICYKDICWQEYTLGSLVSDLTEERIRSSHFAHLDPDINSESLQRASEWRPLFGQTGAAQGHLKKNDVKSGDIFLFFGLFQKVIQLSGKLVWNARSPRQHILWGWLQIDEALKVDECNPSGYEWAKYHPHFHRNPDPNNTVYVARWRLSLPTVFPEGLTGAGIFSRFSEQLMLTDPDAKSPTQWKLPRWFYPRDGQFPLTYHSNLDRWQRTQDNVRLKTVARGQEFILNTEEFPESIEWLKNLLESQ